jgi:cytochrome c oxidase subunit III
MMTGDLNIEQANKQGLSGGRKKIHPHKFTLWIAIGSIIMMFAGLTSAYVVRRSQANWTAYELPVVFWYSTVAIVLSSLTMMLALRNFKQRSMVNYRRLLTATFILGVVFIVLQAVGFTQFIKAGLALGKTNSVDYLYVIVSLHALHVIGGVIALAVMFAKAFSVKIRNYSSVPVEVMATYWHFVDILWLYLLLFLVMVK